MAQKHNEEMISAPMTRYGRLTLEAQRRQLRSDAFTAAEWTANNPILQLGELGSEKDTNKIKVGDGITKWNDLPYSGGGSEGQTIQVEELPEASADELGNIYQFIGTTGDTYTNGYFYKCTGAGEPVVYSWSQVDVQPAPEALPDQSGQSGKFLTTDGSAASWGSVESLPSQTGQSGKFLTTDGTDASWGTINALENTATSPTRSLVINNTGTNKYTGNSVVALNASTSIDISTQSFVAINQSFDYFTQPGAGSINIGASATGPYSVAIGRGKATGQYSTVINALNATTSGDYAIAIGSNCTASAFNSIQIGHAANVATGTNSDANTFKVANANGNFEIMSADGTIPAARHASLPAADGTYVLKLTISGGVPTLAWVAE